MSKKAFIRFTIVLLVITSVEAMSLLNLKKTTYYKLRKMTSQ